MAAGTRRSARVSSSQQSQASSPPASQSSPKNVGQKRKAESGASPGVKRGKKDDKEQKTLEDVMDVDKNGASASASKQPATDEKEDVGAQQDQEQSKDSSEQQTSNGTNGKVDHSERLDELKKEQTKLENEMKQDDGSKSKQDDKSEEKQEPEAEDKSKPHAEQSTSTTNGDNAVEENAREGETPSSILEKGVLYFLYRGRVNIENPTNVQDIARSYLLLRPLPHGAKITDGAIGDEKNCRLLAIPKKTLPIGGNEKWTAFVEKANVGFKDLKEEFISGGSYDTQTQGQQQTPSVTPGAEGVYAITTTGRETHLAYMITLPKDLGEVQHDLGIRDQGSFICSVKNPKAPGPASADLGRDPGFSDALQNEFRSLRWAPLKPDHLNYESCQFLMVGETENQIDHATEPQGNDKDKADPKEELEKLEDEDEARVNHLKGDDAIFTDLGIDKKNYPDLSTTW